MEAQLREKLQPLVLDKVTETSKVLGLGAHCIVTEVVVDGRQCAGKKLHANLEVSVYIFDL